MSLSLCFFHTAIDVDAADIKALFRRCQALEKLGKLDMAFKDVQRCATLEPKNKTFLETLRRLGADIQAKVSLEHVVGHSVNTRFFFFYPGSYGHSVKFVVLHITKVYKLRYDEMFIKTIPYVVYSSRQHFQQIQGCRTCLTFSLTMKWIRKKKKR